MPFILSLSHLSQINMFIKIIDWEAIILTEEEIKKEKAERVKNYWIKIKDTDDQSFIINHDKNKVRPFMRDYISRLPWSLEIRYLTILIILVSIILLFMFYNGIMRSYGWTLATIQTQTKEISAIKEIITKSKSSIPEKIQSLPEDISLIKPVSWSGVFINPMK